MIETLALAAVLYTAPPIKVTEYTRPEVAVAMSRDARDMVGYEESLYTGDWYQPSAEPIRKCIMHRESRYHYRTANPVSSARGAYQFLDNSWRQPLVWMMLDESRKNRDGLVDEIKALAAKPINQWNRYYQDRAFWTAWRFGDGAKHWYHPGIRCF